MRKLYKFFWDCGRMGSVESVFIADSDEVDAKIGSHVHFGEILGKHSDIYGALELKDLEVLSDDQDFINKLHDVFVGDTISGYNPLESISEDEDE